MKPFRTKNNKGKDFSQVDISTNRGMGRYSASTNSAASSGPRLGKPQTPYLWLYEGNEGAIDSSNNALVIRNF